MKKSIFHTKAEAIAMGQARYFEKDYRCPTCQTLNPMRYVENDACAICTLNDALDLTKQSSYYPRTIGEAADLRQPGYYDNVLCKKGPHLLHHPLRGTGCLTCKMQALGRLSEGKEYYKPLEPCRNCGTRARRRTKDHKCTACEVMASIKETNLPPFHGPRKTAKQLGFKIYIDGNKCRRDHDEGRYTSNGMCVRCTAMHQTMRMVNQHKPIFP